MLIDFYPDINVANIGVVTDVAGPGTRLGIWLQGCQKNCSGCINEDYIPIIKKELLDENRIISILNNYKNLDGISYSGGEPFLQAKALAKISQTIKKHFNFSILCYTGYTLQELKTDIPYSEEFLKYIDILIDGAFIKSKISANLKWRGSSNQQIYYLNSDFKQKTDYNTILDCAIKDENVQLTGNSECDVFNKIKLKLKTDFGISII